MAFTAAELVVVNQALARIHSTRLATVSVVTGNEYEHTDLVYDHVRDVLLRSFEWPFASDRKSLSQETNTPDFEWDYKYKLPIDFWRLKSLEEDDGADTENTRFVIEGNYLLTDYSTANLRYIRKVTDPDEFDVLFTEVLILRLAKRLISALAGTMSGKAIEDIDRELRETERRARNVCRQEDNTTGYSSWNRARTTGVS